MPKIRPVVFVWTGNSMVPLPRYKNQCDTQFLVDCEYPLTIIEARSRASHNHYFASVEEAYKNLPDSLKEKFPSATHLRKKALVECGYCTEKNFVCDTDEHAMNLAVYIRSIDEYAIIRLSGNVVKVFEAHSQDAANMGRELFMASKNAVLDYVSTLIGVKTSELKKQGAETFRPEPTRRDHG